jgi:hypothetical protein
MTAAVALVMSFIYGTHLWNGVAQFGSAVACAFP